MHGTKNLKTERLNSVSNFQCSSYSRICSSYKFFQFQMSRTFSRCPHTCYVSEPSYLLGLITVTAQFHLVYCSSFSCHSSSVFIPFFSFVSNLPNCRLHVCDTKLDIPSGFSVTVTCYNKCRTISSPPLLPITRCLIKLLLQIHPLSTSLPSEPQYRIE